MKQNIFWKEIFGKTLEIEFPTKIKEINRFVKHCENNKFKVGDSLILHPTKGADIKLKIIK